MLVFFKLISTLKFSQPRGRWNRYFLPMNPLGYYPMGSHIPSSLISLINMALAINITVILEVDMF